MKLGSKGVYGLKNSDNPDDTYAFSVDSFCENVVDPVGAGDALLAYSTLSQILTGSLTVSSIIGSIAASLECEVNGNIPISAKDVINRIERIEKKIKYSSVN